jgi:hypothetical protein
MAWMAMAAMAATGAMALARRQPVSMAAMVARAALVAARCPAMAAMAAMAALAVMVLPEKALLWEAGPLDLTRQMEATAALVVRVVAPSQVSPVPVASAVQRAMVALAAMEVPARMLPTASRRRPVETVVMVAVVVWVVSAAAAAARVLLVPTAAVVTEVSAARPELPATAVMEARAMRRTSMVRWEALVGMLESQELVARVVLPESVGPLVWLGSAVRPEALRHPAATAATAAMELPA